MAYAAMYRKALGKVKKIDKPRAVARQYVYQSQAVEATLAHGKSVVNYMISLYGQARTNDILGEMSSSMSGTGYRQAVQAHKSLMSTR